MPRASGTDNRMNPGLSKNVPLSRTVDSHEVTYVCSTSVLPTLHLAACAVLTRQTPSQCTRYCPRRSPPGPRAAQERRPALGHHELRSTRMGGPCTH